MAAHLFRLTLFAGVMFFLNLGGFGLMDVDEPRNAGCAMEMFQRGDWVTPTFNAELRTHKPALTYWFMMSAYAVFGVNEFSARFWSAVLGIGTVLMTYGIGRRLFNPQVGFWGGIILASSFFFAISSRISTPDAPLIFCVTLAFFAFVMTTFRRPATGDDTAETAPELVPGCFPSWFAAVGIYTAMGLAVLAKGPVGLILPTAVIGMFLLIIRLPEASQVSGTSLTSLPWWRRAVVVGLRPFAPVHFLKTCWAMRPITALLVCGAVAVPWYWLVHEATHGEWTRGFFLTHNLGRATNAMEGHGGPAALYFAYLLYYPVVILAAFFPWSCFLVPTVLEGRVRSRDPWRPGLIFIACWVLVWVGAFSIARTKLPSYITPVYPGLALFVVVGLVRWLNGRTQLRDLWFRWSFATLAIVGIVMCLALPIVAHFLFRGAEWVGVLGLVPLVGGWLAWREFQRGNRAGALTKFAIAGSLLTLLSLSALLPYVFNFHQRGPELLAEAERNVRTSGSKATVLAFGSIEPSFVFNVRHPIPYFNHAQTNELFSAALADDTFIISRHKDAEWLNGKLPPGFVALHRVPYFARPGLELVLLGRPLLDARTNAPAAR